MRFPHLRAAAVGAGLAAIMFIAAGGLELAGVEPVPFLPPLSLAAHRASCGLPQCRSVRG